MDGTGRSAASRRRAPPLMDPPTPCNWRAQLNFLLGAASRRLFQSQLVLRSASEREIRAELPELCAFAASVCRAAAESSEQRRAIRDAFSDPQAQWLSRGAVESGASGFFCHLLLRETAAAGDEDGATRCVVQMLLDPVLKSCYERLGPSDRANSTCACEWLYEKPQYYAMVCANLWETLLPFLARAARQHADVFGDVLSEQLQAKQMHVHDRVNCRFAQVAGFWRLLDAVGDAKTLDHTPQVKELLPKLLAFVVQWSVLSEERETKVSGAVIDARSDPYAKFYDLLLEKFFHDMQAFLFKCAHATRVTRVALESTLRRHLSMANTLGSSSVFSSHCVRFASFASAACLLVKGLGKKASELIKTHRSVLLSTPDHGSFLLAVGMVSHIESIDVDTVLAVLHELLDRYEEVLDSPTERREVLLWVIYVIVSRQRSLNPNVNSENGEFTRLQDRICVVEMEDLQLMPLHWMETVWKVCLCLQDDEVEAFIEESRALRVSLIQRDDGTSPLAWEELIRRVPFRRLDQYPSILAILGEPFGDSIKQTNLPVALIDDDVLHVLSQKKKRQRVRRDVVLLSDEYEASRQNALLLPDVMERIASFMSAKRLCRLSLVCRAFAGVARSPRLWKPLYVLLVEPLKITCRHGASYEHDWRRMYQAKYGAIKKMQNRQRAMARKAQRTDTMVFCWHEDDHELRMSVAVHSTHLCRECCCNQLSSTPEAATSHRQLHRKYRCPQPLCREALTSAAALKQHVKVNHPAPPKKKDVHHEVDKASTAEQDKTREKSEFKCTVNGCARSYKSLKWLQNHLTRVHGGGDLQNDPDEMAAMGMRGE